MKELVIISGKGGTGKTSITAAFAAFQKNAVFADCDVDAADLFLLLQPLTGKSKPFKCGREASIRQRDCTACGECHEKCRFGAVARKYLKNGEYYYEIEKTACEGCGVCAWICPQKAIDFQERIAGSVIISDTKFGPMVHAKLTPAGENSGKLVSIVKEEARTIAKEQNRELLLVDGPPGIGCPVIASITGASIVLIVTEPTISGAHDMARTIKLAAHFGVQTFVCVNKWNLNPEMTEHIEFEASKAGAAIAGRVPYDKTMTEAQIAGKPVPEFNDGPLSKAIRQIWEKLI